MPEALALALFTLTQNTCCVSFTLKKIIFPSFLKNKKVASSGNHQTFMKAGQVRPQQTIHKYQNTEIHNDINTEIQKYTSK